MRPAPDATENTALLDVVSTEVSQQLVPLSRYTTAPNDALTDIGHYYLVMERSNDIRYNVKKYSLLTVISGTSVWLYGSLGGLIAGTDAVLRGLLISGGVITNFCVTFNASEPFVDYIKSKQGPKELRQYLQQGKSHKVEAITIGGAAFLSAGPVAMAAFSNVDSITLTLVTEVAILQVDNTFLHTFPMLLVMQNPILKTLFSLPFFPFIFGYRCLRSLCCAAETEEKIHAKQRAQLQKEKCQQLKKAMIRTLEMARAEILDQSFKFNGSVKKFWKAKYDIALPKDLRNLSDHRQLKNIAPLTITAAYAPKAVIQIAPRSFCNRVTNFVLNSVMGGGVYAFGSWLSNMGSLGFYKNAIDDLSFTRSEALQWMLTIPANALLVILVGYFAGRFFKHTLFDSLVSLFRGEYQPPVAFKRYPKTTVLFIGLSTFFAYFSYGTALYLMQKGFSDEKYDSIRSTLYFCATYGMPIFTFKNTVDFIFNRVNKFAEYFGEDDNKASAELDARIGDMISFIDAMDGDTLESSLILKSPEERETLLQMSEDEFQRLVTRSLSTNSDQSQRGISLSLGGDRDGYQRLADESHTSAQI